MLCCRAIDLVFTASGSGVYDERSLSHAFRDVHTGRTHITQNWEFNAITYGLIALRLESDNPLLKLGAQFFRGSLTPPLPA